MIRSIINLKFIVVIRKYFSSFPYESTNIKLSPIFTELLWSPVCYKACYWTMHGVKDSLIVNIVTFKLMIAFVTQSSAKFCYWSTEEYKIKRRTWLLKENKLPEFNWYIYHIIVNFAAPPLSTVVAQVEVVRPDLCSDLRGHVVMKHQAREGPLTWEIWYQVTGSKVPPVSEILWL